MLVATIELRSSNLVETESSQGISCLKGSVDTRLEGGGGVTGVGAL